MTPRTLAGLAGLLGLLLAGCLREPRLKSCEELPLGTEGCAAPCDLYCALMDEVCPDTNGEPGPDAQARCRADCAERAVVGLTADERAGADANTLECRIAHARQAQSRPAECASAALDGSPACQDRCPAYCAVMAKNCPNVFPDAESCSAACAVYPDDRAGALALSNSVQCRAAMGRRAAGAPDMCGAAAVTGGGVCGEPCDAYCDQLDAHCADHPIYPDRATCQATCGLLPVGDGPGDAQTETSSIECRIYHASYPAALDPAKHCPHAGVYHAAHCGEICDTYCALMAAHCPGTYAAGACPADCAARVDAHEALWPDPGNQIACAPAP